MTAIWSSSDLATAPGTRFQIMIAKTQTIASATKKPPPCPRKVASPPCSAGTSVPAVVCATSAMRRFHCPQSLFLADRQAGDLGGDVLGHFGRGSEDFGAGGLAGVTDPLV